MTRRRKLLIAFLAAGMFGGYGMEFAHHRHGCSSWRDGYSRFEAGRAFDRAPPPPPQHERGND